MLARRPSRTIQVLTVSALDLFAMAVGSFILLTIVLLPSYHRVADAGGSQPTPRASTAELNAQAGNLARGAQKDEEAAEVARAAAAAARRAVATAEGAAAAARAEARRLLAETKDVEARIAAEVAARARSRGPAVAVIPMPPKPAPLPQAPKTAAALDLVLVIDATSSMEHVLAGVAESLTSFAQVLERLVPSVRIGYVAYRDHDVPAGLIEQFPLTTVDPRNLETIVRFAKTIRAAGPPGQDFTAADAREAVLDGLRKAVEMPFRPNALRRIVVVGDAMAHAHEEGEALALVRRFAEAHGSAVSALYVDTDRARLYKNPDREFFRSLAAAGKGIYSEHQGRIIESILLSVIGD